MKLERKNLKSPKDNSEIVDRIFSVLYFSMGRNFSKEEIGEQLEIAIGGSFPLEVL